MSVTLEFRYNTQDMPEAVKVASKHIRRQQFRSGWNFKRLATWLLFVGFSIVIVYLVSHRQPQSAAPAPPPTTPPPSNGSYTDAIVPLIPWILIFTFVIFFFIAMRRRTLRKLASLEDLRTLTANDDGLIWTEPAMKVEYRWHAFQGFGATPNLFVLYQGDARRGDRIRVLVVPKRAFPTSEMLLEFAELLKTHAREHDGAFPVILTKPIGQSSDAPARHGSDHETGETNAL